MEELGLLPLPRPRKMVAAGIGGGGSGSSEPTDILLPLCACRDLLTGARVLIFRAETPGIWP